MRKLPLSARESERDGPTLAIHSMSAHEILHGTEHDYYEEEPAVRRKYDFNLRGAFVLGILTACVVGAVIAGCYGIWMLAR